MQIIKRTVDALQMPLIGDMTGGYNDKLLQMTFEQEKQFNDPTVTLAPLLTNYKNTVSDAGINLYSYDKNISFIDVDVFRQPALYFKENGTYCKFDPEWNKAAYNRYWDLQEYRMKNGMTAYAGVNGSGERVKIWIPGKHYGFLNFAPINRVRDDDSARDKEERFEDNSNDDEYAAFKVEELIKGLHIRDTRVAKKTIDFPDFFDGQYHLIMYKHICRLLAKNCWFGKARRKGMSFYNSWDLFDDINLNPYVSVILAAHDKKYLTHGKGLMRMLYTYSDWVNKFTAFRKLRLVKNKEHLRFGFLDSQTGDEMGYLSEALAVSAMNNPDVTIGKDAFQLAYEEMGKFPNWKESYNVSTSTAEAGDFKTGHICGWGTGGTEEANWEDFEDVIYNVQVYDGVACDNIWDTGKSGTAVAYFYAHVHALEGFMNYNGNTDFDAAWRSHKERKEQKRVELNDNDEFDGWCGQRANSPQEAFAKSATNIFPRAAIILRKEYLKTTNVHRHIAREGVLVKNQNRVDLVTNHELKALGEQVHEPIYDFPLQRTTDVHGCVVEWFSPYRSAINGKIPDGLYVAIQDPYGHDVDKKNLTTKHSIGSTYVFMNVNKFTPISGIPVACYNGRPPKMDYYNEQTDLLLDRWNAKLMFENMSGDVKPFMQARKALHKLFEEPELQFVKELSGKSGRGYGMHMTPGRKNKGAIYLRDLLTSPITATTTFLDYVFDIAWLDELLRWNLQGNFDRTSAWIIGTYIIKELELLDIQSPDEQPEESFFDRPFY